MFDDPLDVSDGVSFGRHDEPVYPGVRELRDDVPIEQHPTPDRDLESAEFCFILSGNRVKPLDEYAGAGRI